MSKGFATKTSIENKYKDELPIKTVHRIRDILQDIGISVIEDIWDNPLEGFYYVSLRIVGTYIRTIGKGTDPEYALASAYGEFMERLQNQVLYHYDRDFDNSVNKYLNFYYSPDEKYVQIQELNNTLPENLLEIYRPTDYGEKDKFDYLCDISGETPRDCSGDFISIPYYNVSLNKLWYLPMPFLKYYYGSNGMSAGNTPEEAIVQGICEIFERYVNRKILLENITPPNIPMHYIKRYEKQYSIIKRLESSRNLKVIVKDCSLGREIPVVSAISIDTKTGKYFVKFGSHPFFPIALERCLIELLQGRNINSSSWLYPFKYLPKTEQIINNSDNLRMIFRTGEGFYPNSLFGDNYCYEFKGFADRTFYSNKEMLHYLVTFVEKLGINILVRDVSFLGFPAYHIIMPGMSEVFSYNKEEYKKIGMKQKVRRITRNLDKCTNEELQFCVSYMKGTYSNDARLSELTGLPLKKTFPWRKIRYGVFLAAAQYRLGNTHDAYEFIGRFINYVKSVSKENGDGLLYYKCVRDYLAILLESNSKERACKILSPIYGESMVKKIINDLDVPNNIFKYYEKLPCWNCKDCKLRKHCYYEKVKKIHLIMKEKMKKKQINQMELRNVFM